MRLPLIADILNFVWDSYYSDIDKNNPYSLSLFEKKIKSNEVFYSLLCVFILLIKFNRLSEYGYDYISQFILLIVFHKIYFLNSDNSEIIKSILYFILTVLIKPVSLLFIPIMTFIIFKKGIFFYKNISKTLLKAHGLPELIQYTKSRLSLEDAIFDGKHNTKRYIKRQFTWWNNQNFSPLNIRTYFKKSFPNDVIENISIYLKK